MAGARVLRERARKVRPDEFGTLSPLLGAMEALIEKEKAQGLCAPQVGVGLRLFVMAPSQSNGEGEYEEDDEDAQQQLVVINPRVVRQSRARLVDWESCLSVPNYAALVSRPAKVQVEYETLDGAFEEATMAGNRARVFQHELDHLDGVLFTERMIPSSLTHMSIMTDDEAREAVEEDESARLAARDDIRMEER